MICLLRIYLFSTVKVEFLTNIFSLPSGLEWSLFQQLAVLDASAAAAAAATTQCLLFTVLRDTAPDTLNFIATMTSNNIYGQNSSFLLFWTKSVISLCIYNCIFIDFVFLHCDQNKCYLSKQFLTSLHLSSWVCCLLSVSGISGTN